MARYDRSVFSAQAAFRRRETRLLGFRWMQVVVGIEQLRAQRCEGYQMRCLVGILDLAGAQDLVEDGRKET
jgi:hypothetical protein